jgi:hypothetical protein
MNIIKVDAFESSLHGRHVRWFLPTSKNEIYYPPGFLEQCLTETPPFQRKLLVMDTKTSEAWKLVDQWDAIFVPQSSNDWSLIITYLQYQPSPTVIILLNDIVPPAFFAKCRSIKTQPTLVHFQSLSQEHSLKTTGITYDEIFLPKIKEDTTEILQDILKQSISQERMKGLVLKDIFRDLRSSEASLVISFDRNRLAGLFWYYMSENIKKDNLATNILQTILYRNL